MLMVQTKYGILEGVQEEGYAKFLGVPYAQPPVGALRWKRPQPPRHWDGIRKADHFSIVPGRRSRNLPVTDRASIMQKSFMKIQRLCLKWTRTACI